MGYATLFDGEEKTFSRITTTLSSQSWHIAIGACNGFGHCGAAFALFYPPPGQGVERQSTEA